ncbi:NADPH-dependent FMN reductase [Geobacillus thermodenitrificans]|uniref:NAD(P)H-dependent FAD/FMN reductase GTNG_3158 n=1 Tax=Geobacillus thermodenitrificans (strain NG80-2) TaxID=420246 RepID=NFADR_GEOTN|nr:NAD(P)H-dependent oxidoreductase [Geobacillus thermodenitrificans]A4IT49.1 RecName: Full=NAD(P)H-dependent FAD/FMN reductase GTNG_3158; Short=FAD/FMN reductase [Geobacillus thermodenitrificans NG80-2]ABO68503.1 NADH-dependent FMN reductase [Geobacillus thermodenitrificans NG80-2]
MKLLGISGTLVGTKTCILVEQVLVEAKRICPEVDIQLLDLKDYQVEFCDGRQQSSYNEDTQKVIELVSVADCYVIGTPIFQGSITGALKNLFDLISPQALRHKVMGFVANGGTYQHYLVIENQLKPIASFFRAFVAPGSVYAHTDHFNEKNELVDPEVRERVAQLAWEVVHMHWSLKSGGVHAHR